MLQTQTNYEQDYQNVIKYVMGDWTRSSIFEAKQKIFKVRGGEVLNAINKSMNSYLIEFGEHFSAEQVWIKITQQDRYLFLAELYIGPDSLVEVYQANMDAL